MHRCSSFLIAPALSLVCACGPSGPPPASPPPVAACLTFLVQEDGVRGNVYERDVQSAVREATVAELVQAGFSVVRDASAPHDVVAKLSVEPGSRVESGARVRSTLVLAGSGEHIDQLQATAVQEDPSYAPEVAGDLVDGVFRSPKLAGYIRKLRRPESNMQLAVTRLRQEKPASAAAAACPVLPPAPPPPPPPPEFVTGTPQPAAFALVVGVEQYKSAPPVEGARGEAERFARMATTALGVPQDHVRMVLDERADKLGFDLAISWLSGKVTRDSRVYFYFSGRGAPGATLGAPHVLPQDGSPKDVDGTAVPLWALLKKLGDTGAKDVLAIVDACFSGAGGRSAAGQDGPARTVREPAVAPQVYLLSAVHGVQVTAPGPEGKGGLFSHWLFEGLGKGRADVDGDGRVSLAELQLWAGPRVARDAARSGGEQVPMVLGGSATSKAEAFVLVSGLTTP